MQRPDEKKRLLIVAAAAKMFAARPYHKVRLDDIAAAAKVGKGTVYIYFRDKEELYFSLIFDGFAGLVDGLRAQLAPADGSGPRLPAAEGLRRAVDALVAFAYAHPHVFEVMRNVGDVKRLAGADWSAKRQELVGLIADTVRRGVRAGDLDDPNPEMTAACLGGMVRSVRLFGPPGATAGEVADQIYRLLTRGIVVSRDVARPRAGRQKRGVVREGKR
jgi:AcrR family transcriptional regulator